MTLRQHNLFQLGCGLFLATTAPFSVEAFSPLHRQITTPVPITQLAATDDEPFEGTVVVCTASNCSKKGGKKALAVFQELAEASEGRLQVETISCVSDCAECAMGPNVELRAKGDNGPFYPIKNGIKTEADVKGVLGL